jgi:hypothetical protein
MTSSRHRVAGDLLRAFGTLDPTDDRTRAEIAKLLGIDWMPAGAPDPVGRGGVTIPRPVVARQPLAADRAASPGPAPLEMVVPDVPAPASDRPATSLRLVRGPAFAEPRWVRHATAFDAAALGLAPEQPPRPVPELFVAGWNRAILSAALSTARRDGAVDLLALVLRLVRGEALRRLPRRPRPTLARGVQLLLDRSDAMAPFYEDVQRLVRDVRHLVGEAALDVVEFAGCPSRGAGRPDESEWRDCTLPGPGTGAERSLVPARGSAVVCVTDLGIGRVAGGPAPVRPREWLAVAAWLRRAGCPLVGLVPYHEVRWPRALARRLALVHWNRTTTASAVARAVRGRAWRPERR